MQVLITKDCYWIFLAPLKYARSAKCVINNHVTFSQSGGRGGLIAAESILECLRKKDLFSCGCVSDFTAGWYSTLHTHSRFWKLLA